MHLVVLDSRLYSANADDTDVRPLTTDSTSYELAWSPDGKQIAFYSNREGRFELYLMNADGTGQRALTNSAYGNAWPQWSPDGSHIVFASSRDGDWEIYTMAATGNGARRLTWSAGRDAHPAFLASGQQIVFQSPRDYAGTGEADLYAMDTTGARLRRLVARRGFDGVPVPSPDGRQIAFQRGTFDSVARTFHWELVLVDTLGGNERVLSRTRGAVRSRAGVRVATSSCSTRTRAGATNSSR